jgi:hypothetical protein
VAVEGGGHQAEDQQVAEAAAHHGLNTSHFRAGCG